MCPAGRSTGREQTISYVSEKGDERNNRADLDGDGGVLCRKTVSEDRLDKQAQDLEVDEQLERFRKIGARQTEEIGLKPTDSRTVEEGQSMCFEHDIHVCFGSGRLTQSSLSSTAAFSRSFFCFKMALSSYVKSRRMNLGEQGCQRSGGLESDGRW